MAAETAKASCRSVIVDPRRDRQFQAWLATHPAAVLPAAGIIGRDQLSCKPLVPAVSALPAPHCMIVWPVVGIKRAHVAAVAFRALHGDTMEKRTALMALGDWMNFDVPMEQKFEIEQECRRIEKHPEAGTLAAILLRQNYMLQNLLNKAVHEVARLESQLP